MCSNISWLSDQASKLSVVDGVNLRCLQKISIHSGDFKYQIDILLFCRQLNRSIVFYFECLRAYILKSKVQVQLQVQKFKSSSSVALNPPFIVSNLKSTR